MRTGAVNYTADYRPAPEQFEEKRKVQKMVSGSNKPHETIKKLMEKGH
jgi:hypothetical protein